MAPHLIKQHHCVVIRIAVPLHRLHTKSERMFGISDSLEPPQAHIGPDLDHIQRMLSEGSPKTPKDGARASKGAREQANRRNPPAHPRLESQPPHSTFTTHPHRLHTDSPDLQAAMKSQITPVCLSPLDNQAPATLTDIEM